MARLVSQELPIFTLTYDFDVRAHTTDLEGPRLGGGSWNVHEWRWRAQYNVA